MIAQRIALAAQYSQRELVPDMLIMRVAHRQDDPSILGC
jgi:hypothetical protein